MVKLSITSGDDFWLKDTLALDISIWLYTLQKHMATYKHWQLRLLSKM